MAATWQTVRVFISSTFRDMHAERDHLVKVVFPALRERLEKYRVHLIDIDLRWGVTKEQAENDQALDVCLEQIDACRPFFIGLLGERYGWVSRGLAQFAAGTIAAMVAEQIAPVPLSANSLQASSKYGWVRHHTGKSITELEIVYGVLQNPQMRRHAFFYFRDPAAPGLAVPEVIRRTVYCETEPELIAKLHDLKEQIRRSGYPLLDGYPARWDANAYDRPSRSHGRLVGLEAFGDRVRDQLWQAIQEEFQLPEQPPVVTAADPLEEEQDYHERFMESRLRVYVGREQINDALIAFADGNDLVPCLVTGPSGSGKSAALAQFVQTFSQSQIANQKSKILVIPHFIGASPRSTNLRDMLRRFCQVFKTRFGFAEEVPEEVAKLSVTFREFIGKVPLDTRVLLVIDALNQLDEADRAQELYWLPAELPSQVKVIVSCITDSGKTEPVLEAFRRRQHCPVQLAALSDAEQRLIIRQVPSLSAKTLDDDQVQLLLSNPATANPLFLLVALEELRGFASYERLNVRIAAFPREGDTVTAIFTQVIERLAEEFNPKLVETVLTLLASARRGLSERELRELVAGLDGGDDLFPVLRQLRPYLLSRADLIDFYHRNLFKAVRERYLPSEKQQRQAHGRLAEYFNAQDYWLESLEEQQTRTKTLPPTPRPANVRKVGELPWQLLQAADWQRSERLLTDLSFLEAKAEAGMVSDLAADFGAAIGGMPADRPLLRILRLLEEALRRDIHFIARHPTTLFQCLWNSCWWYDCPEAAQHYDFPRPGTSVRGLGVTGDSRQLHEHLQSWRAGRERLLTCFPWLRSLRPPPMHLGTVQLAVLRGHENVVTSVKFSSDGTRIVSGSGDKTVRVWDADSGAELNVLHGHEGWVASVSYSPDGARIVSGSYDQTVRVWEAASGAELKVLHGHEGWVLSVDYSSDGARIVSGSADGTVRVWDVDSGAVLSTLRGHEDGIASVSYSPDGARIVSGSADKTVRVWDAASGAELNVLRGHERSVVSVSYSSNGARLVSGSGDQTVRVWDADSGAELNVLRGHKRFVQSVNYSPQGARIISGSADRTVRVWDADSGEELSVLRGHERSVVSVSYSSNGARLVSGSGDQTVRVWDADSGAELSVLRGHVDDVTSVSYSPDGTRIVSGSNDRTVRVWDAETGECLEVISGAGDVRAIAVGAGPFPWRALTRGLETVIQDVTTGQAVVWFSQSLAHISTHHTGRTWAGGDSSYLCFIQLEGQGP